MNLPVSLSPEVYVVGIIAAMIAGIIMWHLIPVLENIGKPVKKIDGDD